MRPSQRLVSGSGSRFAVLPALAVVVSLSAISGCSKDAPAPAAPVAAAPAASIGSPAGRFVGSSACRSCHAKEFDSWSRSRHRETLRPFGPGVAIRAADGSSTSPYRLAGDGTATGPGPDGKPLKARVEFLVGGRHREDAWVRLPDGRLQVFPISYDLDRKAAFEPTAVLAGRTPPADTVEFWTRAGRNADFACYGCHATGQVVEVAAVSSTGLTLPKSRFVEPGVGCEGCHGPGGPHVDAARGGKPTAGTIAAASASAANLVEVCASCHGLREVLPSPFDSVPAHRYGQPLTVAADPLISLPSNLEFREPFFPDARPATYQQEAIALSQSSCAAKGGLRCSSCHDAHSGALVPALTAADGGDSICASCHEPIVREGLAHAGATALHGTRCLDCHMTSTLRGPGAQPARDHSLTAPGGGVRGAAKSRAELERALGAMASGRPEAADTLAAAAGDASRPWFLRWIALQQLARPASGAPPGATTRAVAGVLADPDPALRRAAARALGRLGGTGFEETLQRATSDADPWVALEAQNALAVLGSPSAGARLLQLVKRPDLIADARAQYAYGHACLVGQDAPRAERALRRALQLHPLMVAAMNDLGLALVAQSRPEEARVVWGNALDLNPRFAAARENLAKLPKAAPARSAAR